jgi:metallophosphoesterase (TIGR00282 family)
LKILAIGDITSPAGLKHLTEKLPSVIRSEGIDICIANAENASFISGISKDSAEELLLHGVDVITGGNHTLQNYSAHSYLEEEKRILRPLNYPPSVPGNGYTIVDTGKYRVLVMNAMGNVHMEPCLDSPYRGIERILRETAGEYDVSVLDIHAEATGEKLAIGFEFDGRINVIFGTHTHVPTADGRVLRRGTAYISDLGMCGESEGILGMDPDSVIYKMKYHMPGKFKAAKGAPSADGVIFELEKEPASGAYRAVGIRRIVI